MSDTTGLQLVSYGEVIVLCVLLSVASLVRVLVFSLTQIFSAQGKGIFYLGIIFVAKAPCSFLSHV